jgi:uncharacterized protein (UPF0332 family)
MKFDWSNYLALAKNLLNQVNISLEERSNKSDSISETSLDEAKLRCAISRAYYSAFCIARNYLRDVEDDYRLNKWKEYKIPPHEYVINTFKESSNKDYKRIGRSLDGLREIRNKVDYEDSISLHVLPANTKIAVETAKQVIDLLKKLEQ